MKKKPHFLIQFICILTAFTGVLLQGLTHKVKLKPLGGYVPNEQPVKLTFNTYLDGTFQDYLTEHAKRNSGFHEICIRSYNQCLYSLFGKWNNNNIVAGNNEEMFLKLYLDEITGKTLKNCFGSEEYFIQRLSLAMLRDSKKSSGNSMQDFSPILRLRDIRQV